MAEGAQNKPLSKTLGSVPPFAIVMIILVVIAGLGLTIFVFFQDRVKSAFSKDDSNLPSEQITKIENLDNLTDSAVNESEKIEQKGDAQDNTVEPITEQAPITLPEEAGKIVRPENER